MNVAHVEAAEAALYHHVVEAFQRRRVLGHIDALLLLGRVTTGAGGDLIQETAKRVLEAEQDRLGTHITFHAASERDKRHGQAVVAASLPRIG